MYGISVLMHQKNVKVENARNIIRDFMVNGQYYDHLGNEEIVVDWKLILGQADKIK